MSEANVEYTAFKMLDEWMVTFTYQDTSGRARDHQELVDSKLAAQLLISQVFASGLRVEDKTKDDGASPPDNPAWYVYPPHRILDAYYFRNWEPISGSVEVSE